MIRPRCYALGLSIALALAGALLHNRSMAQAPGKAGAKLDRSNAPPSKTKTKAAKPVTSIRDANLTIFRLLQEPIDVEWLMKPKTFKEVLSSLQDKLGGKVTFVVDNQALVYALGGGADVPDPTDEEVWLRADQRERMRLDELLRQLVKQVAKNRATFLVRRGIIDIVNRDDAEAGALLHEKVFLNVNERPLMEVLDELSDDTGLTICLDSRVGDKRKSPITAKLRNVCLEDALVAVTESAGLKFVMLRDSVYVTTAENATRISREQRERDKTRVPAPGVREGT